MSSSSAITDSDPMELVSDDEYAPDIVVISSDEEPDQEYVSDDDDLLDDFQPFALIDPAMGVAPLDDDVLALPLHLHDRVIYGHPEGEHLVVYLAVPLDVLPPIVDLDDDHDDIPVFQVDHIEDDLDGGEVFDIAILELPSPVVSVVDISSTASSIAPTPVSSPTSVLPAPAAVPPTPTTDPMHLSGFSHAIPTPPHYHLSPPQPATHTHYDPYAAGPSHWASSPPTYDTPAPYSSGFHPSYYPGAYAPIPPPGMSPSCPYHPAHFPPSSMEDRQLSSELQITILFRRIRELQTEVAALRAAITPQPPPASPLPPLPSSPPPSPPPLPQSPPPPFPPQ